MSTERNWYPEKGGSPLCSLQLADAGRRGDVIFPLPPSHPRSVKEVCLSDGAATVRAGSGFGVDGRQ